MRIQDKLGALITLWFFFIFLIWLTVFILIYAVSTNYIKHKFYETQYQQLTCYLDLLQERSKQLADREKIVNLDDERLSTVLSGVIKAGKKSGIWMGEINIGTEVEFNSDKTLAVTIMVKGDYNQIGRFINNLERSDARFQFTEIGLSTKETKGSGIICKLKGYFIIL